MPCTNCGGPSYPVASFVFQPNAPCNNCDPQECGSNIFSAGCIYYAGPALSCIESAPNERLDSILQKIDAKVCIVSGVDPYPTYNVACLSPVDNQKEFVEKISDEFCSLLTNFNQFVNVTYPSDYEDLEIEIATLNSPNISSCPEIGFSSGDTLKIAITKLSNYVCAIAGTSLDLSGVNWAQCTTVPTPPVTLVEGFNFVVDRLCALQAQITGSVALPTFNNLGTCLASPGANDTLEATVIKIRTRLCTVPTFNPSGYTFGCYTGTLTSASTLDQTLQAILTQTSTNTQSTVTFNPAQFTVGLVNPAQPCLGRTVSLSGGAFTDRLVAATSTDATPGTLEDKLIPGAGIALDFVSDPTQVTISASNIADEKVKVNMAGTAGFLSDKLNGTTGIVSVSLPVVSDEINVTATIDYTALLDALLGILEDGGELTDRFCSIVANCPSPCDAPSGIQVQFVP